MKNKRTNYISKSLLIISMLFCAIKSNGQSFGNKAHYLVDSLDIEKLANSEKKLIDSALTIYHKSKNDTLKIDAINIIVEASLDDNVWPKYNKWINNYIQEKLSNFNINSTGSVDEQVVLSLKKTLASSFVNMGMAFDYNGEKTKALENYNEGLKISESIGYEPVIAACLHNIGFLYQRQKNITKAFDYYFKSLEVSEKLNDKRLIYSTLNNVGALYQNQGDISKALSYQFKSLKISENLKDKRTVAANLNNIASLYKDIGENKLALEHYHKSLKIRDDIGFKRGVALSLNNMGLIYKDEGEISKAFEYYTKAKDISKELNDQSGNAFALNNLGLLFQSQENLKKSLEYFKKSLEIRKAINDREGVTSSLSSIADVYLHQGKTNLARVNGEESLKVAKEIGFPSKIKEASEVLSAIYQKEHNWEKSLKMFKLHIAMKDSISNEKIEKDVLKQKSAYDLEKKEQEIALLSAEGEVRDLKLNKNRVLAIFFSIAFGLALILVFLAYKAYKNKRKINTLLLKQNDEKKAMLQEIHHRVKNNLQVVNSLLNLQSREIGDERIVATFKEAQNRVLSMALLHEKMYRSDDLQYIDTKDHITLLIEDLVKSYAVGKNIKLDIEIDEVDIGIKTLVPLGLIINEMITNSLKYAFINRKEGKIIVNFKQVDNKLFELTFGDDGIGYIPKKESTGIGTKLIQIFSKQLNGTIEKLNSTGTVYRLVFEKID